MAEKNEESASEMKNLEDAIRRRDSKEALHIIRTNAEKEKFKQDLAHHRCFRKETDVKTDDTLLHLAATCLNERYDGVIEEIIKLSPELLASCKEGDHKGQTPFHILIVRKRGDTLKKIKDLLSSDKLVLGKTVTENIFSPKVEGQSFSQTIMEGELPYIVAALTLDKRIAKTVIDMTGANIKQKNSKGNTVYHCLLMHAARYPNKIHKICAMWKFLSTYVDSIQNADDRKIAALVPKYAFRQINSEHMRPLQLAAKLGITELFKQILKSERIENDEDKLFDSYLYDVSVIDTVAHFKVEIERWKQGQEQKKQEKHNKVNHADDTPSNTIGDKDFTIGKLTKQKEWHYTQSVLELVCNSRFSNDKTSVFDMISQPAMKKLIDRKWEACRLKFLLWMFCHFLIMMLYSFHAVQWSIVAFPSNSTHPGTTDTQRNFVLCSSIVLCVVCFPYIIITLLLLVTRFLRRKHRQILQHDIEYIVLLFLFSFGLAADRIWYHIYLEHGVYFLLISLLSGWWFNIFFFRAFEIISYYVAMIQKVIFGDLARFGLFIILSLVTFTIAFQVLFQGPGIPAVYGKDDTSDSVVVYGQTLLINVRLMFGFTDIEVLDKAREPAIAYIVYLSYVVITYLVLLNSLIAMISETCALVRQNESAFYHTQRLAVILFFEDMLYPLWYFNEIFIPSVAFEERPVFRNGKLIYWSYFLKMTEHTFKSDRKDKKVNAIGSPQEKLTLNIQQPYYEEYIDNNKKTAVRLKWRDGPEVELK